MSESLKASALAACNPEDRISLEVADRLGLVPPGAWGDGKIIALILANLPAIIAAIKLSFSAFKEIWDMFNQADDETPTPGPVS